MTLSQWVYFDANTEIHGYREPMFLMCIKIFDLSSAIADFVHCLNAVDRNPKTGAWLDFLLFLCAFYASAVFMQLFLILKLNWQQSTGIAYQQNVNL